MTFGAILKNITFQVETAVDTFWAILRKFGLLFSSISGHTRLSLIEVSDYLPSPQISINKIDKALPASACGLPLISKVDTSIGLTGELYRNAKMSNLNFVAQMSREFSISFCF